MSFKTQKDAQRGIVPPNLPISAKTLQAFAKPVFGFLTWALPIVIQHTRTAYHQFQRLPQNCLMFIYGSVFCFFGGTFPTLFAALQAAEHGGRITVVAALKDLSEEAMVILEESKKDDKIDEDNDGKKDVNTISNKEYVARKTHLVLAKLNPQKVDHAISSMYKVWLSVAAVLSIQFAKTIALSLSLADFLKKPTHRYLMPILNAAIPDEYERWTPLILEWMLKSIAMSVAWYIQSVMSAVTSGLAGGLMMANATYQFCLHRGYGAFGWIVKEDVSKSHLPEILQYVFAGLGIAFQFYHNFQPPFPLNLVLWPFQLAEYYIRWTITK